MGNGDFASGDGYKFRGRGPFQLTGKDNYTGFKNFINNPDADFVKDPSLIITNTEYAIKSSMWFYKYNVVNRLKIETATVEQVSKKVNGGVNGLEERKSTFTKAMDNLCN
jgi:putative chitinase